VGDEHPAYAPAGAWFPLPSPYPCLRSKTPYIQLKDLEERCMYTFPAEYECSPGWNRI